MAINLDKITKFSIAEYFILLEAWFTFLKWDLLISFTQYKSWRSEIADLTTVNKTIKTPDVPLPDQVKQIIKLSEIAGRHHFRKMNCLRRCISQQKLLLKQGFHTCMHIGVNIEEGKLHAHAWLTLQGKVINDNEEVLSRYSVLKQANEHAILCSLK